MQALDVLEREKDEYLEELKEYLRIPSISTSEEHNDDMREAAEWVAGKLDEAGLESTVMETGGHPAVYAEHLEASGPTVLIYGHYDVQPPDPLEEWETEPFQPTVRDGKIYARGATDNKGQQMCNIKAVAALIESGELPVNVKFLIEGEEEMGSPNIGPFIEENREMLEADLVLISDTPMWDRKHPSVIYSLRGLAYFHLRATGADRGLHSGGHGGTAPNAAEWMAKLLASGKDAETGKVLIPGFYDDVEVSEAEREELAKLPFDEEEYKRELGVDELFVEEGWTPVEARTVRPTFEINGIWGGYTDEGEKTVLPNEAGAKVSCRLVGDQEPEEIEQLFQSFVQDFEEDAPGIEFTVEPATSAPPVKMDIDHPAMETAREALRETFTDAEDVVFAAEGGTIPVVAVFDQVLETPTVLMGYGLEEENLHAPNEHFHLENFHRGMEASTRFLVKMGEMEMG